MSPVLQKMSAMTCMSSNEYDARHAGGAGKTGVSGATGAAAIARLRFRAGAELRGTISAAWRGGSAGFGLRSSRSISITGASSADASTPAASRPIWMSSANWRLQLRSRQVGSSHHEALHRIVAGRQELLEVLAALRMDLHVRFAARLGDQGRPANCGLDQEQIDRNQYFNLW